MLSLLSGKQVAVCASCLEPPHLILGKLLMLLVASRPLLDELK